MQIMIDRNRIAARIEQLASELNACYDGVLEDAPVLVVGILCGAFPFLADLMRRFSFPAEINFMRIKSYGTSHQSSGTVQLLFEPDSKPCGRRVLIVEDIIDTGRSMKFLYDYFYDHQACEVRSVVLLDKIARRQIDISCDYVGFVIENRFVAGYGLDGGGAWRQLPDIVAVDPLE